MTELSIREVFEDGRTCNEFSSKEVHNSLLKEIYDLTKLGPTSANSCPLRITFIKTPENKEKLLSCLMDGNVEKTRSAPVVALFSYDCKFYKKLPELFPHNPNFGKMFEANEALSIDTAYRNSTLQAAYFMVIARSFGLDCGPMSGFDAPKLNKEFFSGTDFKVNFICNLGYKQSESPFPRLPKLEFDDVCKNI